MKNFLDHFIKVAFISQEAMASMEKNWAEIRKNTEIARSAVKIKDQKITNHLMAKGVSPEIASGAVAREKLTERGLTIFGEPTSAYKGKK